MSVQADQVERADNPLNIDGRAPLSGNAGTR
jgi:hypothetical protein